MRGLFQLFARYGSFLLFVFLELFSLFLVVRYNQSQRVIFFNSWGLLTASAEQRIDNIGDYIGLKQEVLDLQAKNHKLMEELDNARYNNRLNRDSLQQDSFQQVYTFIGANVISNSVAVANNYLRLDKGSSHGIKPHMGVITDDGVVGIVRHVSSHFCSVMSILHSQSRIKASIKGSGYFGTLVWKNDNPIFMSLEAIPKHASIEEGDVVITSGYSQLFPQGIRIGEIKHVSLDPGENFYNIQVQLDVDMGKLRYVSIVENLMKLEHEELDEAINE